MQFLKPIQVNNRSIKVSTAIVFICYSFCFLQLHSCSQEEFEPEIYLEGSKIKGTEILIPLGLYDGQPLLPSISPDGTKILYTGRYGTSSEGLWIFNLNNQSSVKLHPRGYWGAWSYNGKNVLFVDINNYQVYKVSETGENLIQLTTEGKNYWPRWSPDGKSILFDRSLVGQILMDTTGQNLKVLTATTGSQGAWHPTSNSIISVVRDFNVWYKFSAFDLNTNEVLKVLNGAAMLDNQNPHYSPDGSKILFHNKHGIYVMDKNGDNVKRIEPNHLYNTNYTGDIKKWVANASWYPDGKYIVYEHLDITRKRTAENGLEVEGIMSFYKVNVDSALLTSKLKL